VGAGASSESVLVVESDPEERDRIAARMERSGYQVSTCPGPIGPDYTCVGSRQGTCALTRVGAVIVLDMSLESEAVMTGTSAEDLLALYLFGGHRVVVLGSYPGGEVPGQLIRLPRHPDLDVLAAAVRSLQRQPSTMAL
jgi:CheY-like chemotaxis protein